jgi:hypothetical protein
MECRNVEQMLTAYSEKAVTPEQARLIRQHLSSCTKCRESLEDLEKAGELVRNLEEVEPPPWLTQKIMARVRDESGQKISLWRRFFYPLHIKLPIEVFATILVVGLVTYIYQVNQQEFETARLPAAGQERVIIKDEEKTLPRRVPPPARSNGKENQALRPIESPEASVRDTEAAKEPDPASPETADGALSVNDGWMKGMAGEEKKRAVTEKGPRGNDILRRTGPQAYAPPSPEISFFDGAGSGEKRAALKAKSIPAVSILVRVDDIAAAESQIMTVLGDLGGRNLSSRTNEAGTTSIRAVVQAERIVPLVAELNKIGSARQLTGDLPEGDIAVTIDISSAG